MLSENIKPLKGLAPAADRFNTSPASDVYSMENLEKITFLVIHQGGTTGKGTITVEECDDVTPTNATAIPFRYRRMTTGASDTMGSVSIATAAGIDTVPTEDTIIEIEVEASALSNDRSFIRLQIDEAVNDPVNGCVVALGHLKYKGENPPSCLS